METLSFPLPPTRPDGTAAHPRSRAPVAIVDQREHVVTLLKPPRPRILELASEPVTAVDLAATLGAPRQRIGYHVRKLVDAGLLREVDEKRQGAVVERRYRASARSFVLSPDLLGSLAAHADSGDGASAAHMLGAVHRVQREVGAALAAAADAGERVPTLTLSSQLRLENAEQRGRFASALSRALTQVIAEFADPFEADPSADPAQPGQPFRLTLTLNPTKS